MKSKRIETLVPDIKRVLTDGAQWTKEHEDFFAHTLAEVAKERSLNVGPRGYLGLSQLGAPCKRKLWYEINQPNVMHNFSAEQMGNFFYGDIIEAWVLTLCMVAGHKVEGAQDKVEVFGVKGHRDAVIDGWTVDVKSCSEMSFLKFKGNKLKYEGKDSFGYISQLSSYLYAGQNDPLVIEKDKAAFLAVRKDKFDLCLDVYDLTEEMKNKEKEVGKITRMLQRPGPPLKDIRDEADGKGGNRKLGAPCIYDCPKLQECWPDVRKFQYSNGVRYLTKVVKTPRVEEIK